MVAAVAMKSGTDMSLLRSWAAGSTFASINIRLLRSFGLFCISE